MMHALGFTGTRQGMTPAQSTVVAELVGFFESFHHGDCVGADAQAHDLACTAGLFIVVHPPDRGEHRAFCRGDFHHPPAPYLIRDRAIVENCEVLVATPRRDKPEARSGTWYTIRLARKLGRQLLIVRPNGQILSENLVHS